jgi:membrane protein YdbS with pleckstrin-like domain
VPPRWPLTTLSSVDRPQPRRGIRDTLADPAKRSVLLFAAVLANLVLVSLNLFDVFDHSPTWVSVCVWVVIAVIALVLVGVLTYTVRDWRRRRQAK